MAEVKLRISAEDKATVVLEKMAASGKNASDRLQGAFEQLGTKSSAAYDKLRQSATAAYDRIKNSGVATADELTRAGAAHAARMTAIDEEQFGKRTSLLQKFKANWLAVTAAIGGAWIAANQAWGLAKEGAQGMQQRQGFANLAGSRGLNGDAILAELERVSAGTIATQELVEKAGTSMLLGIDGKVLPKLLEIARASSRITGASITKSFEDVSLAVGRQSKMILDNLGIILDVDKANAAYAASLGKTAASLTDAERKQAFMNATLAAGQQVIDDVGVSGMTTMEKLQRMEATMANLRETAGRVALAIGSFLGGAFQFAAASIHAVVGILTYLPAKLAELTARLPLVGGAFRAVAADLKGINSAAFETAMEGYQDALSSASAGWDALSNNIGGVDEKLTAHQQAMAAARAADEAAAEEKKKTAEAASASASALAAYSKTVSDLGREQLKLAEQGFARDLERQEEFFKKTGTAAANLLQPLRNYLTVLDAVYGAQLATQREIAATLQTIGADQATRLQQEITIATTEKSLAEQRLKAWGTYYGKLKAMHAAALATMAKKQEELLAVQKFGQDLQQALAEKFSPAAALSPYEKFYGDLDRIDADAAAAMQLSGDKKIEALQAVMSRLKELPAEVAIGDQVVISSLQIYDEATSRFRAYQAAAEAAQAAEVAAAGTAAASLAAEMATAQQAMETLQGEITAIDERIAALTRTVTLSLNDQASAPIASIQRALDALQDKTITVRANYINSIPGSGADVTATIPKFENGTPYVPRTGLALVHQGERIIPAAQNRPGAAGGSITIAPQISISMTGPSSDPQQTARELARAILPELQALGARTRT